MQGIQISYDLLDGFFSMIKRSLEKTKPFDLDYQKRQETLDNDAKDGKADDFLSEHNDAPYAFLIVVLRDLDIKFNVLF